MKVEMLSDKIIVYLLDNKKYNEDSDIKKMLIKVFDNLEFTFNPCVEVGMYPKTEDGRSGFQMCNLTEINGAKSTSKEIFFKQRKVASILGTLQAGSFFSSFC